MGRPLPLLSHSAHFHYYYSVESYWPNSSEYKQACRFPDASFFQAFPGDYLRFERLQTLFRGLTYVSRCFPLVPRAAAAPARKDSYYLEAVRLLLIRPGPTNLTK